MKKKIISLLLVVVFVMSLVPVTAVPFVAEDGGTTNAGGNTTPASDTFALPTTYGGKTIDWTVNTKTDKVDVIVYYGGFDVTYWQALINLYNGNDRFASTVGVWLGEGGYVIDNYPGTYDTTNNCQAISLKGINYIATLTDKQVEAAAEEIGYFCFLVEKEDYFFREILSDKMHEGLDVLPAIMQDAIDAIKAKADAVTGGTSYALPTTYGTKTIDWTVESKNNKATVMAYYGGLDVAYWQGLIYSFNSLDFVAGSEGTFGAEESRYNNTVTVWLSEGGYVIDNYPGTYDTSTCGQHEGMLIIQTIAGLTKKQCKNAAKEIGFAIFCASEEYRLFLEADSDKAHEGLDVLPQIMADARADVENAKDYSDNYVRAISATCQTTGMKAYYVDGDGNKYYDRELAEPVESDGDLIIPVLTYHTYNQAVAFDAYLAEEATCTSKATYYYTCICGEVGTTTFAYGNKLPHTYDRQVTTSSCLCTAADCQNAATYYYSCSCGSCGTQTFTYGEPLTTHVYDRKVTEAQYLASEATCASAPHYYFSCVCGEVGTATFAYGNKLPHTYSDGYCTECGREEASEGLTFSYYKKGTSCYVSSYGYVTLPKSGYYVTGIGTCTDTDVVISDTYNDAAVVGILPNAFKDLLTLKSVVMPDTVEYIGSNAFYGCLSLKNIVFSDNLTYLGDAAFCNCARLQSVELPESLTSVDSYAFAECKSLQSVTLPSSLKTLNEGAFSGCTKLASVTLPVSLTFWNTSAFNNCPSLKEITVLGDITLTGEHFTGMSGLETIVIPASNTRYTVTDGCLIDTSTKTLVVGTVNAVIPSDGSVTSVGDYAFYSKKIAGDLVLPECITSVGAYAFYDCDALTSVTLPEGLQTLGSSAFRDCDNLLSVTFGDTLQTIGDGSFYSCDRLQSVTFGTGLQTIGAVAFYDCNSLRSVVLPDMVVSLGASAFYNCYSLTYVKLSESLTSIESGTFNWCALTTVVIPDSVVVIGEYAFQYCGSLSSVVLGEDVVSIGNSAFSNCYNLKTVVNKSVLYLTAGSSDYGKVVYYATDIITPPDGHTFGAFVPEVPATCTSDGVKGYYCCSDCDKYFAFDYTELDSLTLPATGHHYDRWITTEEYLRTAATCTASATYYYSCACGQKGTNWGYDGSSLPHAYDRQVTTSSYLCTAADCQHAATYYYSCSCGACGTRTFTYGEPLTTHVYDRKVTETQYLASEATCASAPRYYFSCVCGERGLTTFAYGDKLPHTYSDGVCTECGQHTPSEGLTFSLATYVETNPTYYFTQQGYVVTGIGTCTDMDVVIPETYEGLPVVGISEGAFINCLTIKNVYVPDSVEAIGRNAFGGCLGLKQITLSENLKVIGNSAFYDCASLRSVTVPSSVTDIYANAFYNCVSLQSVTLSEGLRIIGESAFQNDTSLTTVSLPASLTSLGACAFTACSALKELTLCGNNVTLSARSFTACKALETIRIAASCTRYVVRGNCLIDPETKTLVLGTKNAVIPADGTVVHIGAYAFFGRDIAGDLVLPDSVVSVEEDAFFNCDSLQSVTFGSGTKTVGGGAFYHCDALQSVTFNDGLQTIGYECFRECDLLQSVVLPDSVQSLGSYAFYECDALQAVTLSASLTKIDSSTFGWCRSLSSIVIPDSVVVIENYAFSTCTNMTQVVLGTDLVAIRDDAFFNCSSLTDVVNKSRMNIVARSSDNGCVAYYADEVVTMSDDHVLGDYVAEVPSTCQTHGVKGHYTCVDCGRYFALDLTEIVDLTLPYADHLYNRQVVLAATRATVATCTASATYYYSCAYCDAVSSDLTFSAGDKAAHTYDRQVVEAQYLAADATCSAAATYYYSCACGAKGENTFSYGQPSDDGLSHTFNQQIATQTYLKSAATCTARAVYYYSCACGAKGTDTFEYGTLLPYNEQTDAAIQVGNAAVRQGNRVEMTVSLKNNAGLAGLRAKLTLPEGVSLVEVSDCSMSVTVGKTIVLDSAESFNGTDLFTFVLQVDDTASLGKQTVKLVVLEAVDADRQDIALYSVAGELTINDFLCGDANGDESIDVKDVVLLRQYLADKDPDTGISGVSLAGGADANADGSIDIKDVVLLRQYLANMDPLTGVSTVVLGK